MSAKVLKKLKINLGFKKIHNIIMNRIYLLDIARGIAAISIAIFHYKLNFLELKMNFNKPFIFLMYLVITFLISFCSYKFIEIPLKIIFRNKYLKK